MKKINIICLLLIVLSSCESWLDVQPKTTIKYDKMFENETGFKNALIGSYLLMGQTSLYGKELTVTFLDALANEYVMDVTNPYYQASLHNYDKYLSKIDLIWSNTYRIIANLNAIIEMVEVNKAVLHPTDYANIKAEAYGLRAYLHFDLLRMFGWGNLINTPSNLDKLTIPYVEQFDKHTSKQLKESEVLSKILDDLSVAEELLSRYDVYKQEIASDDYELPNADGFYNNRRGRFNYYAARATQARVYMWMGNYNAALERLKLFIDDKPIGWVNADASLNVEDTKKDLTFTNEHLFNLNVSKLYESLKEYVEKYDITGNFTSSKNLNYFYLSKLQAEELYEIPSGIGLSDYRYMHWYDKTDAASWTILKFYECPNSSSASVNRVPLIRLPELFYYAAECYNELGDTPAAVEMLNKVRVARGILYANNLSTAISKDEFKLELWKEWQKEYVGEGQLFYQYKRLNQVIPGSAVAPSDKLWILPLPKTEVEVGGREDYSKTK